MGRVVGVEPSSFVGVITDTVRIGVNFGGIVGLYKDACVGIVSPESLIVQPVSIDNASANNNIPILGFLLIIIFNPSTPSQLQCIACCV